MKNKFLIILLLLKICVVFGIYFFFPISLTETLKAIIFLTILFLLTRLAQIRIASLYPHQVFAALFINLFRIIASAVYLLCTPALYNTNIYSFIFLYFVFLSLILVIKKKTKIN